MKRRRAKPPEIAVALHYDGDSAPRVTAKGRGVVAEEILNVAARHRVPVRESPQLATVLATIDLGNEIPIALYRAVAEVIAFAYMLKNKVPPPR